MPNRELVCVGLDLKFWDAVKESLQAALDIDHNKYTLDSIKDALEAQEMQLWGIHDGSLKAVFVTQIIDFPNKRAIECIALAGHNPNEWLGVLLSTVEAYGKEKGCNLMETGGRFGWKKLFEKHGWDSFHIKMSKGI